jgi:hypothetical protein
MTRYAQNQLIYYGLLISGVALLWAWKTKNELEG